MRYLLYYLMTEAVNAYLIFYGDLTMAKYFDVVAEIEGEKEVLFGSFDRADCVSEIECEKESWKEQGYKKIKIVSRMTDEKPCPTVYDNLVDKEDFEKVAESENVLDLLSLFEEKTIVKTGDQYFVNDSELLSKCKNAKAVRTGIVTKDQLFQMQAPSFNFELDADQLLAKALEKGFVTAISGEKDLFKINENYK